MAQTLCKPNIIANPLSLLTEFRCIAMPRVKLVELIGGEGDKMPKFIIEYNIVLSATCINSGTQVAFDTVDRASLDDNPDNSTF